ncbi:phosphotransferase [Algihabitans albus]|uniref:phosphotransferase n=1 Tax=Algihabitans albus TaxID=2164067 RepID=UPI000E5D5809|nr:phosphotransferase [Algihabitans albus]
MNVEDSLQESILPAHRFDETALRAYLHGRLDGIEQGLELRQFRGGQSNPTFLLTTGGGQRYVLRKKPPGKLLPKAHQVEREYRVMAALRHTSVPVPRMHLLCEEADVIGTAFYIMDFVAGRILADPAAPGMTPTERRKSRLAMVDVLASLHAVDWRDLGLADFGRSENYLARQVARWSQQYAASRTGAVIPAMDWLTAWLADNSPLERQEVAVVHGDYRPGNLVLHPDRPELIAILDWELSTLGHPLADLAYFCLPYHLPAGQPGLRGLRGHDLKALNLPSEAEVLATYADRSGRAEIGDWGFFLAFSLFRLAAILQGVAARAAQGNASSADAKEVGGRAGLLAEVGQSIAQGRGAATSKGVR